MRGVDSRRAFSAVAAAVLEAVVSVSSGGVVGKADALQGALDAAAVFAVSTETPEPDYVLMAAKAWALAMETRT